MELKGSKTEKNLQTAFAGESQASIKYAYFSSQAKKDGYVQISDIFSETSGNEKEHAKLWFKALNGGKIPDTLANLFSAAEGEQEEWTAMYKDFAEQAKEEGFTQLAFLFEQVAIIEKSHEERYRKLIQRLENGEVFKREGVVMWKCLNCGHIHVAKDAPEVCPVCNHPKSYFELCEENY